MGRHLAAGRGSSCVYERKSFFIVFSLPRQSERQFDYRGGLVRNSLKTGFQESVQ
jgi:hypothetical protein